MPEEYGGQNMPYVMGTAVGEMFSAANMAFTMYQGLTHGRLFRDPRPWLGRAEGTYLPKMVSCDWTGTMNLTEPHCGTDLGLMRTKAEPQEDGSYKITGRRSSSPPASTTWPRTSSTWCWPRSPAARRDQGHVAVHRAESSS
jgi:alkylation response protein AidB-like acyl-CoA dehydrogenase